MVSLNRSTSEEYDEYERYEEDEEYGRYEGYAEEYIKKRINHLRRVGIVVLVISLILLYWFTTSAGGYLKDKFGPHARPGYTKDGKLKVSLEHVRSGIFQPTFEPLQWISAPESNLHDKGLYLTFKNDSYVVNSVLDDSFSRELFKGATFDYEGENLTIDSFVASPNLGKILIRTKTEKNWRHSTFGTYFVFEEKNFYRIGESLSVVKWSPNSEDIAYIKDNDLYIYSTNSHSTIKRITDDGSDLVFNGKPDWVYEEEVLEDDSAIWWSPSGTYLAFFKINETDVHEFAIPYFVQDDQEDPSYPEVRKIKYPKSGSANPVVTLNVYDLSEDVTCTVKTNEDDILLTEISWVGSSKLLAKLSDRSSDVLSVIVADASSRCEHEVVRIEHADGGWWEITHKTLFVPKDEKRSRFYDGYIDLVPINGYNHLVYYSPTNFSTGLPLTSGEWEVVDGPAAMDLETNDVYFVATKKSSTERHLYVVNLEEPLVVKPVTDEKHYGYYGVSFSAGSRFLLLNYLGPDVPYQKIVDLKSTKHDSNIHGNLVGETLYYLEENKKLKKTLENYAIPSKSFNELNLGKDENGEEIIVNSYEILPNDFDPSKRNFYPLFFFVYGGPNSQQVSTTFSVGFNEVIASQLNALVVVVDGRGTGFKGKDFRSVVRDNLGDIEATDQITAASIYRSKSFVDKDKISLFGWSYGGYLTLKTLEKDAGQNFKYGVSVAPVTDWSLYDSVYTERYMHTPQLNPDGYTKSKVHNSTALAQVPRFLLMHGTGDDNVHFQNSLKLLDMLNLDGVENYDVHIFPDSDHSIRYHNANIIVFDKILSWVGHAYSGDYLRELY